MLQTVEEGLAIAREIGDRSGIAYGLGNLGGTLITYSGDLARAKEAASQALEMAEEVHDQISMSLATALLGYAAMREGHYDEARQKVAQTEPILQNIPAIHFFLMVAVAQVAWEENDLDTLAECYRKLSSIARGYASSTLELLTLTIVALRAEKAGHKE